MLLKGADDVDMAPLLPTAVAALRERPVLFQYCAQEVVATRKNAVLSAFIIALTKGGPGACFKCGVFCEGGIMRGCVV